MGAPLPYDHDHDNEIVPFGTTNFRGESKKFGIKTDDRRRHVYIIGKTGMGKTTLLENFVVSDIMNGHGVAYIDPHGDTAEKMLDFIPPHRVNDVVYFSPADMAFPIGFNILEVTNEAQKHLVASGLMGVFKKIWPDVWSPRMEYILLNCVLALLDTPGTTLMGISRILADKDFRRTIVSSIKDPFVKSFWVAEFAKYTDKFASEAIAPVQNKVGQFLSSVIIRNIVAQAQSTIDLRQIMDERKILLVNLSKGAIGEDSMKLLGGMLITRLQLAAMERVNMPEKDRQDFYLYVDEFQNFATESFANILSEARKYRLNLITAHQYIEQLDEKVAAAIFGNVGTIVSFRVGAGDAEQLAKEFAPTFTEEDIINLAFADVYLKLMIDGVASAPFSAHTLPPIAMRTGSRDQVIESSRERYAIKREIIEEKVNQTFAQQMAPRGPAAAGAPEASPAGAPFTEGAGDRQFAVDCARCAKNLKLKFPPDPSRPFFCKECLPLAKAEGLIQPPPRLGPAGPGPRRPIPVPPPPPPSRPTPVTAPKPTAPAVAPHSASRPMPAVKPPPPAPKPEVPKAAPAPRNQPTSKWSDRFAAQDVGSKPINVNVKVELPPAPVPAKPAADADGVREASFDAGKIVVESATEINVPKMPKPALPPRPVNPAKPSGPKPAEVHVKVEAPRPAPAPAPRFVKPLPPPPKEGMFGGKIRIVKEFVDSDELLKKPDEKSIEKTDEKPVEKPLVVLSPTPPALKPPPPQEGGQPRGRIVLPPSTKAKI